jgi:hypothetical protein
LVTRIPDIPDIKVEELLSKSPIINPLSTDNVDVENRTFVYNIFNKLKPQITHYSTMNLDILTSNNTQFIKQYVHELIYELKYLFNIFID